MSASQPNITENQTADSIVIDNNALISIVNSIITSGGQQSETTTTATTGTGVQHGELSPQPQQQQPQPSIQNQDELQQYVLPVDLVLTVDKSNNAIVRAALPSTFTMQSPSLPSMPGMFMPTLTRQTYSGVGQHNYNALPYPYSAYTMQMAALNPMPSVPLPSLPPSVPQVCQYSPYPQYQYPLPSVPLPMSMSMMMPQAQNSFVNMPMPSTTVMPQPLPSVPNFSAPKLIAPSVPTEIERDNATPEIENDNNNSPNVAAAAADSKPKDMEEKLELDDVHDAWCTFDEECRDEPPVQSTVRVSSYLDVAAPKFPHIVETASRNNVVDRDSFVLPPRMRGFPPRTNWAPTRPVAKTGKFVRHDKQTRLLVEFVRHVTMPNRQYYSPNSVYIKTWALKNSGQCEWGHAVSLVYVKGDEHLSMSKRYPVVNAQPGQEVHISVTIKTPPQPGRYCTYFRLSKEGRLFGPRVWVDVLVADNTAASTKNCRQQNTNKHDAHSHVNVIHCQ